jgi:hypothetical protein
MLLDALTGDGIVEGVGDGGSVASVDQHTLRPGQIVLVEGVLDMGQELSPLANEVGPAAKEIPGGPHVGRIGVGLGEESSSEQAGGLERIDAVVLGLGPVDGSHVEGMAEDEGDVVLGTEVGEPVPVEDALRRYDQLLPKGLDGLEEAGAVAREVLVEQDVALGVQNAQKKGAGVKVDPAVVLMLAGIESHGPPPGLDVSLHSTSCLPTSG